MTAEWKAMVITRLKELGMNRQDLANKAKVSPAAITRLLQEGTKSSRLVDSISDLLAIPTPDFADEREFEIITLIRQLRAASPAALDRVVARARMELESIKK